MKFSLYLIIDFLNAKSDLVKVFAQPLPQTNSWVNTSININRSPPREGPVWEIRIEITSQLYKEKLSIIK